MYVSLCIKINIEYGPTCYIGQTVWYTGIVRTNLATLLTNRWAAEHHKNHLYFFFISTRIQTQTFFFSIKTQGICSVSPHVSMSCDKSLALKEKRMIGLNWP